jgi:hypothetical protein
MPRTLKVFNGRGDFRKFDGHFYVCAESKAEVVRMLHSIGYHISLRELNTYWHKGNWGDKMEEIMPEDHREKSVWFVPKDSIVTYKRLL